MCPHGAFGKSPEDCQWCPEGMQGREGSYRGLGPIQERCTCSVNGEAYNTTTGACECQQGWFYDNNVCEVCPDHTVPKGEESGVGGIMERCQCASANKVIHPSLRTCVCTGAYMTSVAEKEQCLCSAGAFSYNGTCMPCPADVSEPTKAGLVVGNGSMEERCRCVEEGATFYNGKCAFNRLADLESVRNGQRCGPSYSECLPQTKKKPKRRKMLVCALQIFLGYSHLSSK